MEEIGQIDTVDQLAPGDMRQFTVDVKMTRDVKSQPRVSYRAANASQSTVLVLEALDDGKITLEQEVTVSKAAAGMGGSQALLDAGSQYKLEDLLRSTIIASANDSAVALAEGKNLSLEALPLDALQGLCDRIGPDVFDVLEYRAAVARRNAPGGTGPLSVARQLEKMKAWQVVLP